MPMDRSKYPANWDKISTRIRARSEGRCECCGECGHDHGAENNDLVFDITAETDTARMLIDMIADIPIRCVALNGSPNPITGSRVVLTVAHLDHDTTNNNSGNLRAFCQRCHNTYDAPFRRKNAARTRRQNAIDAGQKTLFDDDLSGS